MITIWLVDDHAPVERPHVSEDTARRARCVVALVEAPPHQVLQCANVLGIEAPCPGEVAPRDPSGRRPLSSASPPTQAARDGA